MSFQKFKTSSDCVGQKHYNGTKNNNDEITFNKKTDKQTKILVGKCVICDRKSQ